VAEALKALENAGVLSGVHETKGGILAGKKNRAPAGDGNLATAAAFYRLAIQFDEVVSNLALMGFFEG
jgi:hypothetical protein